MTPEDGQRWMFPELDAGIEYWQDIPDERYPDERLWHYLYAFRPKKPSETGFEMKPPYFTSPGWALLMETLQDPGVTFSISTSYYPDIPNDTVAEKALRELFVTLGVARLDSAGALEFPKYTGPDSPAADDSLEVSE